MARGGYRAMVWALVLGLVSACAGGGAAPGGGVRTSLGADLTALQAEYAAGTISQAEYDARRRALLSGTAG